MLDLALVFDTDLARRPPRWRLGNEAWSVLTQHRAPPSPAMLPHGDGRAVLVVPAYLTGDVMTCRLRRFLNRCGFRAFGWGLGLNWGPTERVIAGLEQRIDQLHRAHGAIGVVGISLGGLLARNLAYDRPHAISHVVTVASPFRLPTASLLEPVVRLCARRYSPRVDPARLLRPLPVPSTMIYTRDDGIVAPESCWSAEGSGHVVALGGAHLMLASAPEALVAIVRGLARP